MKNLKRFGGIAAIVLLNIVSGCATIEGPSAYVDGPASTTKMIPTPVPRPVRTIEMYDATQGKRLEKDVLSLSASDIRDRLTSTETLVAIEKRDASGALTYVGSGGKFSRGSYRVTFDYVNYTNQAVQFAGATQTEAIGKIGVGLRVTADLETLSNEVDLSGLMPLALAVKNGKVTGQLQFLVYGMSNGKLPLAVPSQSILDESSIQKSFEAAAAVRILFGLQDTRLEPYLIGVANVQPADAKNALAAVAAKLTK